MAKSYLAAEELARISHTVAELERQCGAHDQNEWGLLMRENLEGKFGIPDKEWKLQVSLAQILEMMTGQFFPTEENTENIFFYYGIDVVNNDVCCTFVRGRPMNRLYPDTSISSPSLH